MLSCVQELLVACWPEPISERCIPRLHSCHYTLCDSWDAFWEPPSDILLLHRLEKELQAVSSNLEARLCPGPWCMPV